MKKIRLEKLSDEERNFLMILTGMMEKEPKKPVAGWDLKKATGYQEKIFRGIANRLESEKLIQIEGNSICSDTMWVRLADGVVFL